MNSCMSNAALEPDAQHKSNFTHCQVSSLTLIRIARGARFGVIEVI